MEIQRCKICDRPFFPEITTTGLVPNFDPRACPKCNQLALENSKEIQSN